MKPRMIWDRGKFIVKQKSTEIGYLDKKGWVFSANMALALILIFLGSTSFVEADKYYDEWTDDIPIIITETVEDQLGNPCSGCTVNLTIFNPNSSITNFSTLMNEVTPGKYNYTLGIYQVGKYPVTIFANKSGYNGTSDITLLTVYDTFPEDTWWEVAGIIMFVTFSGLSALGFAKSNHIGARLFFFVLSILFLVVQVTFIRTMLVASGFAIDSNIVHGVTTIYKLMMWTLRFVIFWIAINFFVEILKTKNIQRLERKMTI